jgi:tetratricopeptide (TPR) repeat protein
VKVLSAAQIAVRLDDCFRLLVGGGRTAVPRQQSLRATIDWSYALLTEPEQALFRQLSVFAGGWTLEAAEAVCAGEQVALDEVLDLLAHLVDKSLVLVEVQGAVARYRMLETVRQYGHERLREAGEMVAIERHAAYYLALAETAEPHMRQPGQMARLRDDHDNLRAALEWAIDSGATELAARLSGALWRYWENRGLLSEGRTWLAAVLARRDELPDRVRAKALWAAGEIAENLADQRALFEESLRLSRALGDKAGIAAVLPDLGVLAQMRGDYAEARAYHDERLALSRDLGDRSSEIHSMTSLGRLALDEGDEPRATALHEEALALARASGYTYGVALALFGLGEVAQRRGAHDQAAVRYSEALGLVRELELSRHTAQLLIFLAELALQRGDLAGAAAHYAESLRLVVKQSERWWIAHCLVGFAQLAAAHGQLGRAVRLSGAAAAFFDALAVPPAFAGRAAFERMLTGWRAELDEETFAAEWAAGRALSLEQAIAEAVANGA